LKITPLASRAAGLGGGLEEDLPPDISSALDHQACVDPRLSFLLSCAIRFDMVERGEMTLDEALDHDLVERFRALGQLSCHCEPEIMQRMDRVHREMRERRLRDWRRRS
jgi:hypothetical protein